MGEFAAIAALAASAASTVTAVAGAQQAQAAGRLQRQQAEQQAMLYGEQRQQVADAAAQEAGNRMVALRRTLGAQEAYRGARGLASDSMGASVLRSASEAELARDLDTIAINAGRERRSLGLAASRAYLSGEAAMAGAQGQALAAYGQAFRSGADALGAARGFLSGAQQPAPRGTP
ncbi:hypothetical protein DFH01_00245 [Falsiroseomonas bella]|uniref:Uncharacterized protein n=1 Tax=Falsiroseomonas bella TaxID=2184016 RepID=A0A317FIA1_9PROT|nr:hypothetical protein [Falsiroseomonas bella]PWS37787.1 hypothetical protein DFH01_00245 [Falsiroseomonas bella]